MFYDTNVFHDFKLTVLINIVLVVVSFSGGLYLGNNKSTIVPLLPEKIKSFKENAREYTIYIVTTNARYGLNVASSVCVPFYGVIAANWRLGFPLGILVRSRINGINYPSLISMAALFIHGLPEYTAFILINSGIALIYVSIVYTIMGRKRSLHAIARYSIASIAGGFVLLIVAALIESYVTPSIVEMLI